MTLLLSVFAALMMTVACLPPALAQTAPAQPAATGSGAQADASTDTGQLPATQRLDSVYFTMDDGVMSREEMEQEAAYVADSCTRNPFQSGYMDCRCLGGAFLIQRERLGPTAMQEDIIQAMTDATSSYAANCIDTAAVAGDFYNQCMLLRKTYFDMAPPEENDSVCSCSANRGARIFAKKPIMDPVYSVSVMAEGMRACLDPTTRPVTQAAAPTTNTILPPPSGATDFRAPN